MSEHEFVEKPFDYIPFATRVQKDPPAGHHHFAADLLTGYLTGTITVLTPLHIASGSIELTKQVAPQFAPATPLIKAFVRSGGVRVIPGSTLKGCVRSVFEAITPSTVGKVGRRVRLPNRDLEEPSKLARNKNAARNLLPPAQNLLSPADRLFGVMDYLGPVQFCDAQQVGNAVELVRLPALFSPRSTAVKGRKFYKHGNPAAGKTPIEAIPVGGSFTFRCEFANLTAAELGALLIAMGKGEPAFNLKLGGGKPVCYGSIGIQLAGIYVYENIVEAYLSWETGIKMLDVKPLVDAALANDKLILRPQLSKLAETLTFTTERNAPSGNY